ncbi:MAG: helix-turn-helix domain-containing protein, partial [Prevotella sp.]
SAAMMTLLDNRYVTRRRFMVHTVMWIAFSSLACIVTFFLPSCIIRTTGILALAVWLVIYGLFLSVRLLRTYKRAITMFEHTHSDDIGSYVRWLSIFTYWAVGYGVSCGLLTFLPDEYVFIWILSSIPFYIYLYCRYQNYILFYERVESALQEDIDMPDISLTDEKGETSTGDMPSYYSDIEKRIEQWIANEGFRTQGLSLNDLSIQLCTNRTYLSDYINNVCHVSFRDWITNLRIDYAKTLMKSQPNLMILEVSEASGFVSKSHFTRTFKAKEGCTPTEWRDKLN